MSSQVSNENADGKSSSKSEEPNGDCKLASKEPPQDYGSVKHVTIEEGNTEIITSCDVDKKIERYAFIDRLFLSSSAIFNTNKYMDCTVTSSTTLCLNGLRVISMFWIILGHSQEYIVFTRLDNNLRFLELSETFTAGAIRTFPFGVDTFFFLSGLLLTYLTLKQLAKGNGKINWALFYFHRFWRITPTYMLLLAIWMNLFLKWGHGPDHDLYGEREAYDKCKPEWWLHLLYINNLYPYPGSIAGCFGWTWYLANDMQFFIISPFIIYPLYRFWKAGILTIVVLFLTSFGSTIYLCVYWGIGFANTGFYNDRVANDPRPGDDYLYAKPWHRIPPYLIGILFGYMLYKLKGRSIQIGWWKNLLGWLIAAGTAMTVVYVGYATSPDTPQWAAVLYVTFSRTLFTLSVAWVTFSCIMGYGGLVNQFLSWSVWIPLGRLTFAAYLFHPAMIAWVLTTKKTLMHLTYVDFSYWFVANVVFSYACAFIFVLLVEGPTGSLEDALLGSRRRGNKDKNK
ncbi:nose resistant to fluoxetine protein 6-like [Amphiura filiformis]|uniref:nose resistant to fluoxetine protein 6-like n=1 Tax=Amphiura filiformis TaxID=82378 RepID=UPI003B20CFBB